jgi:hypothetical protein
MSSTAAPGERSPRELFVEWYLSTPPEVRDQLAFDFGVFAPADALTGDSKTHPLGAQELCDRLPPLAAHPLGEVGLILMLRAFVDFAFSKRSTEEDWNVVRNRNFAISAMAKEEGEEHMASTLEGISERMALRSRLWIREAKRWSELRNSTLSDATIDRWLEGALANRARDLYSVSVRATAS